MPSPVHEGGREEYSFPAFTPSQPPNQRPETQETHERRSSDGDGTLRESDEIDNNHLRVTTSYMKGDDPGHNRVPMSPSGQREQSRRLADDLEMLQAERIVSSTNESNNHDVNRARSRTNAEPIDDFDIGTTPIHEKTKVYQPPENPTTKLAKIFKKIHNSSFLIRYFFYIAPLALLLLSPTLLGYFVFPDAHVGHVRLLWFGIWLEIVWLTLWAARIISKCIPYPMGVIASIFTNNEKKWRDLGKQLELPATLFFWWLAIEISFLPTMKNHHIDGDKTTRQWETVVNKIILSLFVAATLNFIEKIIIQLIAISFHLRTYADRIEINKFQISSLVKLYRYSKDKIAMEDSEFEEKNVAGTASGARTPMQYVTKVQKNARQVMSKVGDAAGKVAGDFTGKAVATSTHPHQVILTLLNTTTGSQVLARRLYRTFVKDDDSETVLSDDLKPAFDNDEEAVAAFTMFDKDLNGDISMEELEAVCVEIGRERKAITASLKDLDSVVSKLDDIFLFIVVIITILVFVSIISTSASGILTSLGSSVLALSWLFSATAQEFLQSCIFVFVKHPFDVGDRVTIYGNTGSQMKGDDYFVKTISLLYTEFKKMEGHVVQAPNSYLNTLFILNQRRSGGLAEAVPVTVKFGTTLQQIDSLRQRLLDFVGSENREYQKNILTELTTIYEAHSITINVIFFYKSNWQNELLRLQRRNKFICAMMVTMTELGMEGPRMRLAGAAQEYPFHLNGAYPQGPAANDPRFPGSGPDSAFAPPTQAEPPFVSRQTSSAHGSLPPRSQPSILRSRADSDARHRGESLGQMSKRVDFSLGMSGISSGDVYGDIYEDRAPVHVPRFNNSPPPPRPSTGGRGSEDNNSLGRSTSRDSQFGKIHSANSGRTHMNRFFNRGRSKLGRSSEDEGTNLDELEAGTREREFAMQAIPESNTGGTSRSNSQNWGQEERSPMLENFGGPGRSDPRTEHIDPRTGIVSTQAMMQDGARERGELPLASPPRRAMTDMSGGSGEKKFH
ncbi:hypothetical protein HYALB_00007478 [Hymenoscyphus albidus]|uniref:EF-hand domain-containing protein n=1 Tax=Hymenoscyphus albidus TaxID=595503 RepID=A0A9N9Q3M5_9HELO|nr:hypothetical protein HYALB_00007478 [Hymenoscyphus albidus]